ncbi:hypothetical protein [Roseateles sp.]|uniref:hypothetical protein n=1 Tax=Roseateles sp. TaxID=1971397 RepID=UPI001DEABCF6|nr:hypothetical protein [Roseateles sp.]MBV8036527.1 hypothetical protein [Roseateles sp.]MBV8603684.1 hypothetical protein [Roseateles sp.]
MNSRNSNTDPSTGTTGFDDALADQTEHGRLLLGQTAIEGLVDVVAGRVLSEAELDAALATPRDTAGYHGGNSREPS